MRFCICGGRQSAVFEPTKLPEKHLRTERSDNSSSVANSTTDTSQSPRDISSDDDYSGHAEQEVQVQAEVSSVPTTPESLPTLQVVRSKPDFSGRWRLAKTIGDFDTFLTHCNMSWVHRKAAKALGYGMGKVEVRCTHASDNEIHFTKALTDPRRRPAKVEFVVGDGSESPITDDIGDLLATSKWEGARLRFDARMIAENDKPVTLLMYFDEQNNFVEEMISCKGTSILYVFEDAGPLEEPSNETKAADPTSDAALPEASNAADGTEATETEVTERGTTSEAAAASAPATAQASSDLTSAAAAVEAASQPAAERTDKPEEANSYPNFEGQWKLTHLEGDFDTFLSECDMGWLLRKAAKGLGYGMGKVKISCSHPSARDITFTKVLTDPRRSPAPAQFKIGGGPTTLEDDIGTLIALATWDGERLRYDATIASSGKTVTMYMFLNERGNFIEEMISYKGTTISYVFTREGDAP